MAAESNGHHNSFYFLQQIPGLEHVPQHVIHAGFVSVVLIGTMLIARAQIASVMKRADGGVVPDSKWTYRNFFEVIAEKLYQLTVNVIGEHDAPIFYPMVGTMFAFIFVSNLLGLIPGFGASTDNLNTTLALGAFAFLYYNYAGFKSHGIAYLKHFLGPMIWIAPLMLVIEVVSHIFRPISLALRLRGNIMGDHTVLGVFSDMVPYGLPIIFMGLGIFVSFIQAFVFCLMTMVYISMSTSHDH